MCKVEGLDCPRDRFDTGHGSGAAGEPLERLMASLKRAGAFLTREEREEVEEGWRSGRLEWEAAKIESERDVKPIDWSDIPL